MMWVLKDLFSRHRYDVDVTGKGGVKWRFTVSPSRREAFRLADRLVSGTHSLHGEYYHSESRTYHPGWVDLGDPETDVSVHRMVDGASAASWRKRKGKWRKDKRPWYI